MTTTQIEKVRCFKIGSKVFVREEQTVWTITGFTLPWPGTDAVASATTGKRGSTFRLSELSLAGPNGNGIGA